MAGEDPRVRAALERMRGRIAREAQRRPTGGEIKDRNGRPIGEPGKPLTPREVELAAQSLTVRVERDSRTPAPAKDLRAPESDAVAELSSPEAIREGFLKSEQGERDHAKGER